MSSYIKNWEETTEFRAILHEEALEKVCITYPGPWLSSINFLWKQISSGTGTVRGNGIPG